MQTRQLSPELLSSNKSRSELRLAKGDPRFELTAAYQSQLQMLQIGAAPTVIVERMQYTPCLRVLTAGKNMMRIGSSEWQLPTIHAQGAPNTGSQSESGSLLYIVR